MLQLKNTYLFRLYTQFKALFVVVCMFIGGTLWFAFHSHEEFPFLLYGMYSLPESANDTCEWYSIELFGREITYEDFPDTKRELITSPLYHYNSEKPTNITPTEFYGWLFFYLQKTVSLEGPQIKVNQYLYRYNKQGRPILLSKKVVYDANE